MQQPRPRADARRGRKTRSASVSASSGSRHTSGSSDIGTAIIYAVVFGGLLALSYYAGPARYSADYYLEKKISWWWRLAEVRRPEAPAAVSPARHATVQPGAIPQPARRPMTCRPGIPSPSS